MAGKSIDKKFLFFFFLFLCFINKKKQKNKKYEKLVCESIISKKQFLNWIKKFNNSFKEFPRNYDFPIKIYHTNVKNLRHDFLRINSKNIFNLKKVKVRWFTIQKNKIFKNYIFLSKIF